MAKDRSKIVGLLILGIVIVLGGFYIYNDARRSYFLSGTVLPKKTDSLGVALQTDKGNSSGYTTTILPLPSGNTLKKTVPLPNITVPIVSDGTLPSDAFAIYKKNIEQVSALLKKDPQNRDAWLNLAIYWKSIGNYEVPKEVWFYMTKVWPDDYIPYSNLGDLYQYYLHDYAAAEANILKSIDLEPDFAQSYQNLAVLYKEDLKRPADVLPTLLRGLKNNPTNTNIMLSIARYYREVGDEINAKKYYDMVITQARALGNTELLEPTINEEAGK